MLRTGGMRYGISPGTAGVIFLPPPHNDERPPPRRASRSNRSARVAPPIPNNRAGRRTGR